MPGVTGASEDVQHIAIARVKLCSVNGLLCYNQLYALAAPAYTAKTVWSDRSSCQASGSEYKNVNGFCVHPEAPDLDLLADSDTSNTHLRPAC
jgi:hypothetical protein